MVLFPISLTIWSNVQPYVLDECLIAYSEQCSDFTYLNPVNKFQGRDSSDGEELDGAPDDDEYDTEDSFIDDVELVSISISDAIKVSLDS